MWFLITLRLSASQGHVSKLVLYYVNAGNFPNETDKHFFFYLLSLLIILGCGRTVLKNFFYLCTRILGRPKLRRWYKKKKEVSTTKVKFFLSFLPAFIISSCHHHHHHHCLAAAALNEEKKKERQNDGGGGW